MSEALGSLSAIAATRRALGDVVDEHPDHVVARASVDGAPSVIEIRWHGSARLVHVTEILALEVPVHAVSAVTANIMAVNAALATPGFTLRETQNGRRVAFVAYAVIDDDQRVAASVVDEVVRLVRVNAIAYLPQFTARVAEASMPVEARLLAEYDRRNPRLTTDDGAALRAQIQRDAGPFIPRLANAMVATLEQPFFRHTILLEIVSPTPLPARTLYCARASDGAVHVLTRRLAAIQAVCRLDPPVGLDHADQARAFANLVAVLTAHEHGELRVAAFGDIPWRARLSDHDLLQISTLRVALGPRIAGPTFAPTDSGYRLSYWCIAAGQLQRRTISVASTGEIEIGADDVVAVPVPPGHTWGVVDGRLVPTS